MCDSFDLLIRVHAVAFIWATSNCGLKRCNTGIMLRFEGAIERFSRGKLLFGDVPLVSLLNCPDCLTFTATLDAFQLFNYSREFFGQFIVCFLVVLSPSGRQHDNYRSDKERQQPRKSNCSMATVDGLSCGPSCILRSIDGELSVDATLVPLAISDDRQDSGLFDLGQGFGEPHLPNARTGWLEPC